MATTITIKGSVTLDESLGLQNSGITTGAEDNNDSDVSLATLQAAVASFSNRLFNSAATGGLNLSTTFATNNGVAESASDFIMVSGGTVTSLGFVDGNGGTLPVYSSGVDPSTGVATILSAVDGGASATSVDIGQQLTFEDDRPSITATATGAPSLTVDETVLATNDAKAFAAQFTPVFGTDGQGATPVSYALSTPGGASGLTDTATGESVVLSLNASGQVVGQTATMATTITINGSVTLDESLGLQNSGVPVTGEDNNDSDVSLTTLQTGALTFYNRLFNSVASGGLALSTSFATNNGVAESASNFITVSGGTVASLGFVDGNGGALPVFGSGGTGVATSLSAVNGGAIRLFAEDSLPTRRLAIAWCSESTRPATSCSLSSWIRMRR